MNLIKQGDFFDPRMLKSQRVHIIGCGSVGSCIAELLTRFGVDRFVLYDFDYVEEKNLVNQMFNRGDIGYMKVDAVADLMKSINPDVQFETVSAGWTGQKLDGYVFLAVDSVELRKKICEANKMNQNVKAMFDFRTRLTDAQHYAAKWNDYKSVKGFMSQMNFTDNEAKAATPTSACGITLGVAPTVRLVVNAGVCNFINFVKGEPLKKMILVDAFKFQTVAV